VPDHAAPEREAAGARRETRARVESLDIIRAVLIVLVVYAHLVEHFGDRDPAFQAVYAALSIFGLPLFVLVSGMLAKPLLGDKDYRTMFAKLLLPLVCLQAVYLVLLLYVGGDPVRHLLDPQWLLWFLLSLCLWRMMLPLFLRLPLALPVAIALTLAAGYAEYIGADLSLSRTLYFFPFFLAGYLWRESLPKLVARARPLWGLVFALLMTGVFFWSLHGLDPGVVYHDRGYDRAAVWESFPALGRLGLLLISALGALAWMAIMPRKSRWLARLGRRTLTILALHGFVVLVCLKVFNVVGWTDSPSPILFPVLLALAVAIAWGVSLLDGPFNRFFDWLAAQLSRMSPRVQSG
jgi:fucose 4-O-acetylase-like acetyltransferase